MEIEEKVQMAVKDFNKYHKKKATARLTDISKNEISIELSDTELAEDMRERLENIVKAHFIIHQKQGTKSGIIVKYRLKSEDPFDEVFEILDKYEEGTPPRGMEGYED